MPDAVINKTIYESVQQQYFEGLEPQRGVQVNFPHVTLVRPRLNCLKGMLSEVEEILDEIYKIRSDVHPDAPLREKIDKITDESISYYEDKILEEIVDLIFYAMGFLGLYYSDDKINEIFLKGVEKNYARGYFTQTEYSRDKTRGY